MIRDTSENPTEFDLDRKYLPEEQKRVLECEIEEYRTRLNDLMVQYAATDSQNDNDLLVQSLNKEIQRLSRAIKNKEKELEDLGGRTRERLIKVLGRYKPERDSEWFVHGYGDFEGHKFKEILSERLPESFPGLEIGQIIVDDRGMGTGRTLRMLLDIVRKKYGIQNMWKFAKNCHGVDLMEGNAEDARQLFKTDKYGVPDGNITQGSYLDETGPRLGKKVHLITCMMHSIMHCTTEQDWINFFTRANNDLHVGGFLVFDVVAMRGVDQNDPGNITTLSDISDLYTNLWLEYCHANQRHIPQEAEYDLTTRKRHPIFDNTTGCGFYQREVPDVEFILYILKKIGGKFNMHIKTRVPYDRERAREGELGLDDAQCVSLGRKWIHDNGFEAKCHKVIKERLKQENSTPGFLHRDISSKTAGCANELERIEALLNHVAFMMVRVYQNTYYILHKVA